MRAAALKKLCFIGPLLILALAVTALPAAAKKLVPKVDNIIFLLDHSGSMVQTYQGKYYNYTKILLAKDAAVEINYNIPDLNYKSGVFTFAPFVQLSPVAPYNQTTVHNAIAPIEINYPIYGNLTPLGPGLTALDPVISGLSGKTAVILFTDGDDNLGVNAVAEATRLQTKYGDRLCFMVVSFADNDHGKEQVKKIAALSGCHCLIEGESLLANREAEEKFLRCGLYEEEQESSEIIIFRSIYFDFNKSNIKKEFVPVLNEGVSVIKAKKYPQVILEGHTDSVGTQEYNQRLSERRANSVKAYLVKKGVPADEITTVGYGKTRPIASNATAEGRRLNRRVEIKFKPMN
jgi:OOP family OmpA-OmpF porin